MAIKHRVAQGEGIPSIAYRYGLAPDTIWDAPENNALRALRDTPDVLMPGDEVHIPDRRHKAVDADTGCRHRFVRRGIPARTRIRVLLHDQPRAHQEYTLVIDGRTLEGSTDGDGVLEEFIPPAARRGILTIGPDQQVFELLFGELDPITEISGIQKRLSNLGFEPGPLDGQLSETTRRALRRFQRRMGLPETGDPDDETVAALHELHDQRSALPPPAEDAR